MPSAIVILAASLAYKVVALVLLGAVAQRLPIRILFHSAILNATSKCNLFTDSFFPVNVNLSFVVAGVTS